MAGSDLAKALSSDDPLRVAIRGHIALEDLITDGISRMFKRMPADIRDLRFAKKLPLAVALDLIPEEYNALLLELNKLRNAFAHRDDTLSPERAKHLVDLTAPLVKGIIDQQLAEARVSTPLGQLRFVLMVAYVLSEQAITRGVKLREAQIAAHARTQYGSVLAAALASVPRAGDGEKPPDGATTTGEAD
jgi:hypothetical protein